jgi:hypothetical protein
MRYGLQEMIDEICKLLVAAWDAGEEGRPTIASIVEGVRCQHPQIAIEPHKLVRMAVEQTVDRLRAREGARMVEVQADHEMTIKIGDAWAAIPKGISMQPARLAEHWLAAACGVRVRDQ